MWELVLAQQNRPPQDCRSCLFWLTTQLQKKIQGTKVKQGVVHQSRYNGFNFEIITLLFYCLGKCGKAPDCREGLSEREKLQFTFYSQQVLGVTSISLRSNIKTALVDDDGVNNLDNNIHNDECDGESPLVMMIRMMMILIKNLVSHPLVREAI